MSNYSHVTLALGSVVKNLPANAGDAGSIPGQEDPLEEEMATCYSIFAWKIPWTEEPGRLQSMGSQKVRHDLVIDKNNNKTWTWL